MSENMNEDNKELIVIEQQSNESVVSRFPLCLLEKKSYTGIKGLLGVFFWLSLLYFIYGMINLLFWGNTFWAIVWDLFSKPVYFIYHLSLFSFFYCFTWAVFDYRSFKDSFIRIILIILSIIYVISPIDIIPDITPMIGQADDLAALLIGLYNTFYVIKYRSIKTENKPTDNKYESESSK